MKCAKCESDVAAYVLLRTTRDGNLTYTLVEQSGGETGTFCHSCLTDGFDLRYDQQADMLASVEVDTSDLESALSDLYSAGEDIQSEASGVTEAAEVDVDDWKTLRDEDISYAVSCAIDNVEANFDTAREAAIEVEEALTALEESGGGPDIEEMESALRSRDEHRERRLKANKESIDRLTAKLTETTERVAELTAQIEELTAPKEGE